MIIRGSAAALSLGSLQVKPTAIAIWVIFICSSPAKLASAGHQMSDYWTGHNSPRGSVHPHLHTCDLSPL
jgi:hypothetical protein